MGTLVISWPSLTVIPFLFSRTSSSTYIPRRFAIFEDIPLFLFLIPRPRVSDRYRCLFMGPYPSHSLMNLLPLLGFFWTAALPFACMFVYLTPRPRLYKYLPLLIDTAGEFLELLLSTQVWPMPEWTSSSTRV